MYYTFNSTDTLLQLSYESCHFIYGVSCQKQCRPEDNVSLDLVEMLLQSKSETKMFLSKQKLKKIHYQQGYLRGVQRTF